MNDPPPEPLVPEPLIPSLDVSPSPLDTSPLDTSPPLDKDELGYPDGLYQYILNMCFFTPSILSLDFIMETLSVAQWGLRCF
jgi:hypothetical protein